MKAYTTDTVNSLSLLSLKVASNTFDLSSRLHHVSVRDQIVRAQLLVRDLKKGDKNFNSLLIVGAGVAGVAAALEAVDQGVAEVVVLEANKIPFAQLHGVHTRYVGPYMYEWPSSFSTDQSYPGHDGSPWANNSKSPLCWESDSPITADKLAKFFVANLKDRLTLFEKELKAPLKIYVEVGKDSIRKFLRSFVSHESKATISRLQKRIPQKSLSYIGHKDYPLWPSGETKTPICRPNYVFLATGMGAETVKLVKKNIFGDDYFGPNFFGKRFWSNDDLLNRNTNNLNVSIFGGGDGAMQDVLRVLTKKNHPLNLIQSLERDPLTRAALQSVYPLLLDAERQCRQFGSWTTSSYKYSVIDDICRRQAARIATLRCVASTVCRQIVLGTGKLSLFVRGKHFDKAYLLNRFLLHLILACKRAHPHIWIGHMDFEVYFEHVAVAYRRRVLQHVVTIKRGNEYLAANARQPNTAIHRRKECNHQLAEKKLKHPPVKVRRCKSSSARRGKLLPFKGVIEKLGRNSASSFQHICDKIIVRFGIDNATLPAAQMIQISNKPSRQRTTLANVELPFVVHNLPE